MVILHCYVSLPEGTVSQKNMGIFDGDPTNCNWLTTGYLGNVGIHHPIVWWHFMKISWGYTREKPWKAELLIWDSPWWKTIPKSPFSWIETIPKWELNGWQGLPEIIIQLSRFIHPNGHKKINYDTEKLDDLVINYGNWINDIGKWLWYQLWYQLPEIG